MSFKEYFWKKVVPVYFMIVTFLNIGMLIVGEIFFSDVSLGYDIFVSPLLFGVIGCVPTLMEFLFRKKAVNKTAMILQNIIQIITLEICVLGAAWLLGGIDSIQTAVIIAVMVFVIFVIIWAMQYFQDKKLCEEMNSALSQYKNN